MCQFLEPKESVSSTNARGFFMLTRFEAFLANVVYKFAKIQQFQSWWNWTANFSLSSVCRKLFAWHRKFGEIDSWYLHVFLFIKIRQWTDDKSNITIAKKGTQFGSQNGLRERKTFQWKMIFRRLSWQIFCVVPIRR